VKDEREVTSRDSTGVGSISLITSPENTPNPEGSRGSFNRRGFLGQTTAMLAAAFGGIWSLTNPKRAGALGASGPTQNICMEPCGGPPPIPPPPPNYTVESEALVNNLIAAFNAHNASELVSYMDSATIDTADLETHLVNNFTAFPQVAISVSSMTAGAYGDSVTIDWEITGEYQVVVNDSLVEANGVNPTQNDVITGTTEFLISTGSIIYDMDTTHNIVPIFAAHGATVL